MESLERWLDDQLVPSVKSLELGTRSLLRYWRNLQQAIRIGDLASLIDCLAQIESQCGQVPQVTHDARAIAGSYDVKAYLENNFDRDFREACNGVGMPLEGQFPRYEAFPVVIEVDLRNPGVLINRRRYRGLRVSWLAETVKGERDGMLNQPFNARQFLEELASQYDAVVELESAKHRVQFFGQDISLRHIYQRLTPMRQWRSQYPERFFAFDLHRLLRSGEKQTRDGRHIRLAPANIARNNLLVFDTTGRQVQLGLVSFRKE